MNNFFKITTLLTLSITSCLADQSTNIDVDRESLGDLAPHNTLNPIDDMDPVDKNESNDQAETQPENNEPAKPVENSDHVESVSNETDDKSDNNEASLDQNSTKEAQAEDSSFESKENVSMLFKIKKNSDDSVTITFYTKNDKALAGYINLSKTDNNFVRIESFSAADNKLDTAKEMFLNFIELCIHPNTKSLVVNSNNDATSELFKSLGFIEKETIDGVMTFVHNLNVNNSAE